MGRPWWYDSYWDKQKNKKRRRGFSLRGPLLPWLILVVIALLITFWRTFK